MQALDTLLQRQPQTPAPPSVGRGQVAGMDLGHRWYAPGTHITIRGLGKSFGEHTLYDGFDLDIPKGKIDRESLVASLPEAERQGLQRLLDSSLGLQIFRRAFDQERAAWEKTFWLMALDQSFGKKPWTGPQGWREWMEPPSARQGAAQK